MVSVRINLHVWDKTGILLGKDSEQQSNNGATVEQNKDGGASVYSIRQIFLEGPQLRPTG